MTLARFDVSHIDSGRVGEDQLRVRQPDARGPSTVNLRIDIAVGMEIS